MIDPQRRAGPIPPAPLPHMPSMQQGPPSGAGSFHHRMDPAVAALPPSTSTQPIPIGPPPGHYGPMPGPGMQPGRASLPAVSELADDEEVPTLLARGLVATLVALVTAVVVILLGLVVILGTE